MKDFYVETLNRLSAKGVLRRDMRVLVICGGEYDRNSLLACGFSDVTISNLDERQVESDHQPYATSFQDAENLTYENDSFDVCIAHSGLHHCRSPHRALLEMYRVSRLGLIVFEPADNLMSRVGTRLGLGQQHELASVADNDCQAGGVRNTPIPNYVYRWTPREVEKTINSYAPIGKHHFLYSYAMRLNWQHARVTKNRLKYLFFRLMSAPAWVFGKIFRRECNNFAFVVMKPRIPDDLHPWIAQVDGEMQLNATWVQQRFH